MEDLLKGPMLPLLLMLPVFYLLILRPKQKEMKETESMLSSLKKGDKVITTGGIYGVVQSVDKEIIQLRIGDASKVEFSKAAIAKKIEKTDKIETKS